MNHIPSFVQLTPLIATSGQPGPDDFHGIAAAGHVAVINIAMPDSENALADEGRRVTEVGMTYVHIPVPFDAPRARHLAQFTAALSAFEGERVWIHCPMNLRVSAFLFHYLRGTGMEEADARSPVLARWAPHWAPQLGTPYGRGLEALPGSTDLIASNVGRGSVRHALRSTACTPP